MNTKPDQILLLRIMLQIRTPINKGNNLTNLHLWTYLKTHLRFFNEVKIITITNLILKRTKNLNFQFTFRKIHPQNIKKSPSPTAQDIMF